MMAEHAHEWRISLHKRCIKCEHCSEHMGLFYANDRLNKYETLKATNTALLVALRQAIADIERTGYVSVPTCIAMEEAIRKAKGD